VADPVDVDGGAARLTALDRLGLMDTAPEVRFDRLTRIAASALGVPIAFVGYVDDRRQWFKSAVGLDTTEVPIDASICRYVVERGESIVVDDATADPRFGAIAAAADVRLYAGVPIADRDGTVVGTFCVCGPEARRLEPHERALLEELAELAAEETVSMDRVEAAARVLEGERWFERVAEATLDGLVVADEAGTVVRVNRAAEAMFGWPRSALIGRSVRELLAAEHAGVFDEAVARMRRSSGLADLTEVVGGVRVYSGLRRDGTVFPMEVATSVPDETGTPLYIFSVRDISDRVAAYGELERSESRFRALSESAPVGIVQTTPNLRCVYVNAAWSAMTGIPELEAIAQPWTAGVHPDDVPGFEAAWAAAQRDDRELAVEFRLLARDGRVTFVVGHAVTVVGADGDVEGCLLTVQDVSVLHDTRSTLADAEDLYQRVVDSMSEGVVIQDARGAVVTTNRAGAAMLAGDHDAADGRDTLARTWSSLRPAGGGDHPAAVALATGEPLVGVLVEVPSVAGPRSIRVSSIPLRRVDDGVPRGVVSTFSDVTESLALARMKDEFVSTVSHELRTPLTSIRGALGLLVGGATVGLEPTARRMLEIAETNARRLVRLIDDILDIERMESGRAPLHVADVDVGDLVQQAADTMRALADQAQVTIALELQPSAAVADADRILQVLTNLISNAVKFSPPGATVTITVERVGDVVEVRVDDEGRGVPEDRLATIFERFEQVDMSDSRERGGTGLGLAICRSIVEHHGGRIGVTSAVGRGSTFWFTLPVGGPGTSAVAPLSAATSERAAAGTPGTPGTSEADRSTLERAARGHRVLLVEDDGDLAGVLIEMLAERGLDVRCVSTLDDARAMAADPVDLVLLDLHLPDGNGMDLVAPVRERQPDVPIVAFSALERGATGAHHDDEQLTEYHVKGRTEPDVFADRIADLVLRGLRRGTPAPPAPITPAGGSS
jgi:PAS domain S-box-containing protein